MSSLSRFCCWGTDISPGKMSQVAGSKERQQFSWAISWASVWVSVDNEKWINQKLWLAAHFLCRFHCHHCTTNFVKLLSWKILIIVVNVYKGFSFIPCLKLDWNRDVIVVIISKIIASSMVIVATWFFWKYQHQGSFVFYTADLCFLHPSYIYVVNSLFATTPTAAAHFW